MTWTVTAMWVPPGARVRDGITVTVASDVDAYRRDDALAFITWMARSSTCGGVIVAAWESVQNRGERTIAVWRDGGTKAGVRQTTRGYPAHSCGSPMVPADVLGLPTREAEQLVCVGLCGYVRASAADRMTANIAARAERRGKAS